MLDITPDTSGGFCSRWAGVASGQRVGRWSAMKTRSFGGRRQAGPGLKKSPERGPDDRIRRRKRADGTTASVPHLVAARADSGPAVPLQLEESVGNRRR